VRGFVIAVVTFFGAGAAAAAFTVVLDAVLLTVFFAAALVFGAAFLALRFFTRGMVPPVSTEKEQTLPS